MGNYQPAESNIRSYDRMLDIPAFIDSHPETYMYTCIAPRKINERRLKTTFN